MESLPKYPCSMKYLSPTSLSTFEKNKTEFILNYVLRLARPKQLKVMSIGSAFDCRCKAYLGSRLCGWDEPKTFEQLFEDSVESHNRDWALSNSESLFAKYQQTGALAELMLELTGFQAEPRFEFVASKSIVERAVHSDEAMVTVPLYGKPDCYFVNAEGAHVILDWKVNGYCSQASPAPGYVRLRDELGINTGSYKNVTVLKFKGIALTYGYPLKEDWNNQLIIYSWLLGDGNVSFKPEEWILGIEQLACRNNTLRVASFRIGRKEDDARNLWQRIVTAWTYIQAGHYFPDISRGESDARVDNLANGGKDLAWMLRGL